MKYEVKFTNQFKKDLKLAKKQKIHGLLKAELVMSLRVLNKISYIIAAIKQLAGDRFLHAIDHFVADNITDFCKSYKNTASVTIAKAALNVILLVQVRSDDVVVFCKA